MDPSRPPARFEPALKFWHDLYSNTLEGVVQLPFGERFVPRRVFGSRFEISTVCDSAGLQNVDVVLWLFAR